MAPFSEIFISQNHPADNSSGATLIDSFAFRGKKTLALNMLSDCELKVPNFTSCFSPPPPRLSHHCGNEIGVPDVRLNRVRARSAAARVTRGRFLKKIELRRSSKFELS
jgi:hypothetical protein